MKKTMLLLCMTFVCLTAACSKQEKKEPVITPTPVPQSNPEIEPMDSAATDEENSMEAFDPDQIAEKYVLREKMDSDYIKSVNDFSVDLSNLLLKDQKVNKAISPVSIQMALSLAALGAEGNTKEELLKTLHLLNTDTSYQLEQNELLYLLLDTKDSISKLNLANSIWLGRNTRFEEDFLNNAKAHYFADLYEADFTNPATADRMSDWIYDNTGKLIRPEVQLDPEQILSIINTIYYKDEWIDEFDEKETQSGSFYLADGNEVEAEYMRKTQNPYGYVKGDNYISTSLWLKGNAGMHFILPEEGVGIDELLSDPKMLQEALFSEEQQYARINFEIPKFSFGSKYELKEAMKKLGISEAFLPEADFDGIADTDPLYISNIEHQAHIGIDENGVEAAAFTQIAYMGAGAPVGAEIIDFKLNRPFLFAISKEGIILFIGVVYNPINK